MRFWIGQGTSLLGSQVTNLALPLAAMAIFGASAGQVGLLRFVELAPYLLLSLPFGVWVDRSRRRPVMIAANAGRMLLLAAVPVLAHFGALSIHGLIGVAALAGVLAVLFDVSWASYLPTLVRRREQLVEANQKLGITQSTTDLAGPGLAGLLISAIGALPAMLLDAASYAVSTLTLLFIRSPEPLSPTVGPRSFSRELVEGVRFVFTNPVLRPLALIAPFTNFSLTAVSTVFLLDGVRVLGLTAAQIGLVFSASAAGALLGAVFSRPLMERFQPGPLYVVALTGLYGAPILLPLASGPRPVVLAVLVTGLLLSYLGSGLSNVIQLSLRQTHTPATLMGRMSAAFRTLLFGGGAVGGLAAGLLAQAVGDHRALWITAAGSAAMVVPIALSPVRRLRNPPTTQT